MAKDDFENGIWRTVGGRRIFIRDGEDLASAMKRSGKFRVTGKIGGKDLTPDQMVEFDKQAQNLESELESRKNGKSEKESSEKKSWRDEDKEDGGTLRDTALKAYKNGDISKKELIEQYFNEKTEDGGVSRDAALEAYKDGDISLEELNRDYLGRGKVKNLSGKNETDNKGREVSQKEYDEFRQAYKDGKISKEDYKNDNYDALKNLSNEKDDQVMSQKEYDKLMRESGMYEKHKGENINYDDYVRATKDVGVAEVNKSIRDEIEYQNSKKQGVDKLKDKLSGKDKENFTDKQLEMVWENEDATEIYNYLTAGERNKLDRAYEDAQSGNKSAQKYIEETENKAARKFLDAHKSDKDYEGYYMSDKYVAEENKKADIGNQKYDIEQASGVKVKQAFETDAFGTGKADRFVLEDGRIVEHTTESFGQKEDTWSVHPKGMQGKSEHFNSLKEATDYLSKESKGKVGKSNNDAYKNAFNEYKKKHPNSKLNLDDFIKISEGK